MTHADSIASIGSESYFHLISLKGIYYFYFQYSFSRIDILISEAKAYRHWADKTDNPKFYRSWAGYLGYLKNRGYGSGEKEICRRLNVTSRDILNVVKRHIR